MNDIQTEQQQQPEPPSKKEKHGGTLTKNGVTFRGVGPVAPAATFEQALKENPKMTLKEFLSRFGNKA